MSGWCGAELPEGEARLVPATLPPTRRAPPSGPRGRGAGGGGVTHPWQPWLLKFWAQSTSCCSASESILPVWMATADSRAPVVEKVQQLPQPPWFFTLETNGPFFLQSTEDG